MLPAESREAASDSSEHSHSADSETEPNTRIASSSLSPPPSSAHSHSHAPIQQSTALAQASSVCQPLPAASLVECTYELYGDHLVWLQLMQQRYHISSPSKAFRILLTFIQSLPAATQRGVFTRIRCKHCGLRQTKRPTAFALYPHQQQWLTQWTDEWQVTGGESKAARIVLDYVQWGERRRGMTDVEVGDMLEAMERDIFTVIRCQDPLCTEQHNPQTTDTAAVAGNKQSDH